ncbi:patatin-like phospholipase family protein [Paraferrimonas haliotis]|uniref:Patatin n=1 Tax=Paraferrimonas haliotis TaxID=2013866 RepID=A0AA37TR12_9GAMM|nr:patatin-like phospholipase family protein [Paraferrimonas haliotis]GLS82707.1 patatin [Paraferrimonas haliotis]
MTHKISRKLSLQLNPQAANTALMLGGGGARAAYQIGVLKALASMYPRNHGLPFQVLCGTSAGAINAASLGCYASCFHLGVRKLEYVWRNMQTSDIYRSAWWPLFKHLGGMWLRNFQRQPNIKTPASLFDNQPLRHLLGRVVDFKRLDRNIERKALVALCVDTSSYSDSHSYSFYQSASQQDWHRARRCGKATQLRYAHLMASTAIPLVFPAVKIDQDYHGDGSIHQLSPISSAIHLGASKILIVNLDSPHKPQAKQFNGAPATADVLGHLLDTIFSDTLNSDLERLHRINHTLNQLPNGQSTQGLKNIDTMVIKPSRDLSEMALEHYKSMPLAVRFVMRLAGISKHSNSSFISYVLFERSYTRQLIELGERDAMALKGRLKAFFQRP